jgi:hypothetical protein
LCTRVNRGLLTSVLTSTDILPEFISVVDMNYDPFGSFSYPPNSMSVPCVALMSELFCVFGSIGWLSILCYTVRCRTVFIMINLSSVCRIRYRVFPVRRRHLCLLYSGSRTLFVPIRYTVYRIVGYLRTKDRGMISSVHSCVMYISFRRIALYLFQILIIIIRP